MNTDDNEDMALIESFGENSRALTVTDPLDIELRKVLTETKSANPKPNLAVRILGVKGCAIAAALLATVTFFSARSFFSKAHFMPLKAGYYTLRSYKDLRTMPYDDAQKVDELNVGDCIASNGDASKFGYDDYKGLRGLLKKHWLRLPPQAEWQKEPAYISEEDVEFISEERPENCTHCRYITESKIVPDEREVVYKTERKKTWFSDKTTEYTKKEAYLRTAYETHREEYETCEIE